MADGGDMEGARRLLVEELDTLSAMRGWAVTVKAPCPTKCVIMNDAGYRTRGAIGFFKRSFSRDLSGRLPIANNCTEQVVFGKKKEAGREPSEKIMFSTFKAPFLAAQLSR